MFINKHSKTFNTNDKKIKVEKMNCVGVLMPAVINVIISRYYLTASVIITIVV